MNYKPGEGVLTGETVFLISVHISFGIKVLINYNQYNYYLVTLIFVIDGWYLVRTMTLAGTRYRSDQALSWIAVLLGALDIAMAVSAILLGVWQWSSIVDRRTPFAGS